MLPHYSKYFTLGDGVKQFLVHSHQTGEMEDFSNACILRDFIDSGDIETDCDDLGVRRFKLDSSLLYLTTYGQSFCRPHPVLDHI